MAVASSRVSMTWGAIFSQRRWSRAESPRRNPPRQAKPAMDRAAVSMCRCFSPMYMGRVLHPEREGSERGGSWQDLQPQPALGELALEHLAGGGLVGPAQHAAVFVPQDGVAPVQGGQGADAVEPLQGMLPLLPGPLEVADHALLQALPALEQPLPMPLESQPGVLAQQAAVQLGPAALSPLQLAALESQQDRKSTRLNSSHVAI